MPSNPVLLACAAAVLLAAPALGAAEPLRYHLSPGWVDLADPATAAASYPANAVNEARSGKYRIYAIEPETAIPQGAAALMNVLELDTRGRITQEVMRHGAEEAFNNARALHYDMIVLDTRLARLGDVDIGIMDSTLGSPAGTMRLRQYFVPGTPKSAVITYGCAPSQFEHYRPLFETSAMATTGAYAAAGFDWQQAMGGALKGAILGALIGAAAFAVRKKTKSRTAAATTVPAGTAAPAVTWACPVCHRRVPLRIAECRCGASRPPDGT
jgi:hypothetical protein